MDTLLGLDPEHEHCLTQNPYLATGTFGRIYHGVLLGEDESDVDSEQDVFIKTVNGDCNQPTIFSDRSKTESCCSDSAFSANVWLVSCSKTLKRQH